MSNTLTWVIRICIVLLLVVLSLTCTMILRELKDADLIIIEDRPTVVIPEPRTMGA